MVTSATIITMPKQLVQLRDSLFHSNCSNVAIMLSGSHCCILTPLLLPSYLISLMRLRPVLQTYDPKSAAQQWVAKIRPITWRHWISLQPNNGYWTLSLTAQGWLVQVFASTSKVWTSAIVEAIRLQIMASRSPSVAWLTPLLNFHKNLQIVSKVIRRSDRLTQNSDLISFPSIFFKKNKLKMKAGLWYLQSVSQSVRLSSTNELTFEPIGIF
jgi:hypothetical protein